ncbi:MAG: zinc ribbon domain-containing protein [Candidatus Bathyarchaeia archaeon]
MPYCEKCGSPVSPDANFCGKCGAPRKPASTPPIQNTQPSPAVNSAIPPPPPPPEPSTQAPPPTQPPPQQTGEVTYGLLVLRKPKSLGRYDSYAGVVTSQRLIFAQLTADMINAAAQQARDQAKAEGKGFFGQWADQLKNTFGFTNRYLTMAPEAILSETPGNYALPNNGIAEIKVHLKGDHDNNARRYFEIEFKSSNGNYKFQCDDNSQFTNLLKQVYGSRVKMPFGYHSTTINIKF